MLETLIGVTSAVASIVLRIVDRKRKYLIFTATLSLISAVAFLIAAIRKKNDENDDDLELSY